VVDRDDLTANDEVLARAAELIGSALFSSQELDTKPSANIEASPEQLQRYAQQLTPLIELGFVDKYVRRAPIPPVPPPAHPPTPPRYGLKEVVQVLEGLTAANIGSNEDKEVTVDAVIHQLEKAENAKTA
jgi:hypothetical protein